MSFLAPPSNDIYQSISDIAMLNVWGRRPRGYQRYVVPHILKMLSNEIPSQAVLLVQSTGSGKSSVPQTVGVVNGGVTVVVEQTLALGADQCSKISQSKSSTTDNISVKAIHLDAIKDDEDRKRLCSTIERHFRTVKHSTLSVFLFTSPEALLLPVWNKFLLTLIQLNVLRLFCIDEVHLFVDFGLSFRSAFQNLKDNVLNKLTTSEVTILKVPILLMTATFDMKLLNIIQNMLGIPVYSQNIFWGNIFSFDKRHIQIKMKYTTQPFRFLKNLSEEYLTDDQSKKMIVYSNTSKRVNDLEEKFCSYLDCDSSKLIGDTVLIVGEQESELKFHYSTGFTQSKFDHSKTLKEYESIFYPRFLFGTPGCVGAGIDSDEVCIVFREGPPTSILNLCQELGRCGRGNASSADRDDNVGDTASSNLFFVTFNMDHFIYLFERIYIDDCNDVETIHNDDITESNNDEYNSKSNNSSASMSIVGDEVTTPFDEQKKILEEEQHWRHSTLFQVLGLMTLDYGCWHSYIQTSSADFRQLTYSMHNSFKCNDKCPNCDKSQFAMIKIISRRGICKFLVDSFLNNESSTQMTPRQLATRLFEYVDVGQKIYCRRSSVYAESTSVCSMTILQLIAAEILCLKMRDKKAYIFLSFDSSTSTPNYALDKHWNHIHHFP